MIRLNGNLDYQTKLYRDPKYVRMAGNTLCNGVLVIVDAVFQVNTAYEILHVYMGYDGNPSKAVCTDGFRLANDIIDCCETMLKKVGRL